MFSWLVSLRYRMFQTLLLDFNHNRCMIGTRVVWNNPSHISRTFSLFERKLEISDACMNGRFRPGYSRSHSNRLRLTKCVLFLPLVSYWEVVTGILMFCGLFLVNMIFPLMRVKTIFLSLLKRKHLHLQLKKTFVFSGFEWLKAVFFCP